MADPDAGLSGAQMTNAARRQRGVFISRS